MALDEFEREILDKLEGGEYGKMRDHAFELIGDVRDFIQQHCIQMRGEKIREMDKTGGARALDIRNYPDDYLMTCEALAELEYQLVRLADLNFYEVVDEVRIDRMEKLAARRPVGGHAWQE